MHDEHLKIGWQTFLKACEQCRGTKEFGQFFDLFLTIEEKEHLSSRILIVSALLEGKLTQREIADTFHVSIAQITRGSNALKIADPMIKKKLI